MNLVHNHCTFCKIISNREPATFHHKEDDFVVFENNLYWFPIQLLLVPRLHISQSQLWSDAELLAKLGLCANAIGQNKCPNGYRILSNFNEDGLQSQQHAHLHLIGGTNLGLYVNGKPPLLPHLSQKKF